MSTKKESIDIAGFQCGTKAIFLVHDFTSNGYTGWIKVRALIAFRPSNFFKFLLQHISKVALNSTPNIVSVDWEAGAEPPFAQAIANARVVALEMIAFINELQVPISLND